jgi:single-strand DNA-binding protein
MAGSVNKVILVGNLGRDPETRDMTSGGKVTSFSVATSETWNDKASGDRREKTQWHRIAIFNERLGEIAQRYLRKGSKVYIEGQLESREYTDKDGNKREAFEVVIGRFKGELTLLDGRGGGGETGESSESGGGYGAGRPQASSERGGGWDRGGGGGSGGGGGRSSGGGRAPAKSDLDDDIPF